MVVCIAIYLSWGQLVQLMDYKVTKLLVGTQSAQSDARVPVWYLKDGAADAWTPEWYPRDEPVDAQTLEERHQRNESVLSRITTKQPPFNPTRLAVSQEAISFALERSISGRYALM